MPSFGRPRVLNDSTEDEEVFSSRGPGNKVSSEEKQFYDFLKTFSCPITPCSDVGKAYRANPTPGSWLHVFINSLTTFELWRSTPGIKIHAGCACMEQDRTHPHIHLLVELTRSQVALKKYWQRKSIKNLKYKTKKIICGDRLVGVYRYLGCSRGGERNVKRKQLAHIHFNRQVLPENVKHARGYACKHVREYIMEEMFPGGDIPDHDPDTYPCKNSKENKQKYRKKRSANCEFYKTPIGIELASKSCQRDKLEVQLQLAMVEKEYPKIIEISNILESLRIQIRELMTKKTEFVVDWNARRLLESDSEEETCIRIKPSDVRRSKRRRVCKKSNLKEDGISIVPSSNEDDYYSD